MLFFGQISLLPGPAAMGLQPPPKIWFSCVRTTRLRRPSAREKSRCSKRILHHIQQMNGVQLALGAAPGQLLHGRSVRGNIRDERDLSPATFRFLKCSNPKRTVVPQLGREQLLAYKCIPKNERHAPSVKNTAGPSLHARNHAGCSGRIRGCPAAASLHCRFFKISLWKSRTNQHKISLLCTFVQHILDFLFWAISQFQFSRHLSLLFLCNSWFSIKSCAALAFCPVAHPSVFRSVRALPRPDLAPRTGTFGAACFFWGSASVLAARRGPVPAAGFINQTSAKIDFSSFSFRILPLLLKITAGFSAYCAGFPGFPTFFPRFRGAGRLWFTSMCPDMPWSGA